MNKSFFRALAALLAFGVIMGCASVGGGQRVTRVSDPARGFSFSVSPELTPQEVKDAFYHYRLEARGIDVYVEAVPAGTEEEGVEESLRSAGIDPASLVLDGSAAFGDWRARRLIDRGRERAVAVAYQMRGGVVYSLIAAASASAMPGDPLFCAWVFRELPVLRSRGRRCCGHHPGGVGGTRARCGRARRREHIPRGDS